jgi:malate synthase
MPSELSEISSPSQTKILTPEAVQFLNDLNRNFNSKRLKLLKDRIDQQNIYNHLQLPHAPQETYSIRKDPNWTVLEAPKDLQKRWIEITGPTDKKMVINALNSGANTFMADFEDANCPTWENLIEGQANLTEAVRRSLTFTNEQGKTYNLNEEIATLMVRPRGWHLPEKHFLLDGQPTSGSLFDFGLYLFHNAKELIKRGSGPYFYLAKLETYHEAALWNEVFDYSEKVLGLPPNSIKCTVLIETIPAAFQMEEILYVLKNHIVGLNAGRWDYLFSIIKKLRYQANTAFPDRDQLTMALPFMQAYAQLLVSICHRRGAHAIGGMSAFIPSRKDEEINKKAFAKVYEDKEREIKQGFDGAWVAHPDLVPIARQPFEKKMGKRYNQIGWDLSPFRITNDDLLNFKFENYHITDAGVRQNIQVTLRYLAGWFSGVGAQAINNLMEDAATAEISRAQLWIWRLRKMKINNQTPFTKDVFEKYLKEEMHRIETDATFPYQKNLHKAEDLLKRLVLELNFPEFLTLPAYEYIK